MIAVIFELYPRTEQTESYFDIASELKPHLQQIDGFISVERFESVVQKGKFLSLSFWRDEEAVKQWRNLMLHREAQQAGRQRVFTDYRLRVAQVIRDYGMEEREQAPADSNKANL
jgi:heme-degrading monooxygenase HmoA